MKCVKLTALITLMFCCLVPVAAEDSETKNHKNLAEALKDGSFSIGLTWRLEDVSDDAAPMDAFASKLRTAARYNSGQFRWFSVKVEFEDVTDLGARLKHDNGGAGSLSNGVVGRPKIVDPEVTEVQQASLSYHGLHDTTVTVGRQEFGLGNQRFIGPVGWRMNHQSYDGVRIDQSSIPRTDLTYVYLDRANAITGAGRGMGSHLLQVKIDTDDWGTVSPYWFDVDFDDMASAGQSTSTFGASWDGAIRTGEWKLPFRVELAQQQESGDNPASVDAGYRHLMIGAKRENWSIAIGQEVLEGNAVDGAFTTPLATLHAFNGWADKFLGTPGNGLEDLYLSVGYTLDALTTKLIFHDFSAESAGPDHGSEIDGVVSYKSSWGQVFAVKFALFSADNASPLTDADKLWFFTSYRF
ncbi:MAG: alginate export family protein [Acidobacteriota bacterium]|nr:alginate export family protein [Acidobacteriota bacterium]MDH3785366.1 alginate export family protein [Acidobacteriota bacterium]